MTVHTFIHRLARIILSTLDKLFTDLFTVLILQYRFMFRLSGLPLIFSISGRLGFETNCTCNIDVSNVH